MKNLIAKALVERILRAARDHQRFKVREKCISPHIYILTVSLVLRAVQVVVVIPEVPGFAGNISDQTAIKTILAAQWRTINRGGHSIYEEITKAGYDPYVRFSFLYCMPVPTPTPYGRRRA